MYLLVVSIFEFVDIDFLYVGLIFSCVYEIVYGLNKVIVYILSYK